MNVKAGRILKAAIQIFKQAHSPHRILFSHPFSNSTKIQKPRISSTKDEIPSNQLKSFLSIIKANTTSGNK